MGRLPRGPGIDPTHGWFTLVTPADARRFRVGNQGLAATLELAGATLVQIDPDVEIGRRSDIRGDAACALIIARATRPGSRLPRPLRGPARLFGATSLRAQMALAVRAVRRRGYPNVAVIRWETGHPLPLPGLTSGQPRSITQRLPLNGVVVATRDASPVTSFGAALRAASAETQRPLADSVEVRIGSSGVVVAIAGGAVLRVATGPARRLIEAQQFVLAQLAASRPAPAVAARTPAPLGQGEAGLVAWTLESRRPGVPPGPILPEAVVAECLDFLVELHRLGPVNVHRPALPSRDAEVVAAILGPTAAARLRALGLDLDQKLRAVRCGFAHRDFWSGNLLTHAGGLTGVVDWSAAGAHRLPVLDLVHLQLSAVREISGERLGEAVAAHLLQDSRPCLDDVLVDYCTRIGLDLRTTDLGALMLAYWLERLALGVLDPDSSDDLEGRGWERDIEIVLNEIGRSRPLRNAPVRTALYPVVA